MLAAGRKTDRAWRAATGRRAKPGRPAVARDPVFLVGPADDLAHAAHPAYALLRVQPFLDIGLFELAGGNDDARQTGLRSLRVDASPVRRAKDGYGLTARRRVPVIPEHGVAARVLPSRPQITESSL